MVRKTVSLDEQETSISLSPQDQNAVVYSCEPAVIRRLYSYAAENPQCVITRDDGYGVICEMPKEWVIYRPRKKRQLSDEQKQAAAERFHRYREQKHD